MIPIRKVKELIGISYESMRRRINNNELPGAIKLNTGWHITDNDLEILKQEIEFINNSYTLKQAGEILNLSPETVKNKIQENDIRKYGNIFYVTKQAIDNLLNTVSIIDNNEYLTISEISELSGASNGYINDGISCGYIKDYIKINGLNYVHKSMVNILNEECICRENWYKRSDLIKVLNITKAKLKYIIDILLLEVENKEIRSVTYFNNETINKMIDKYGSPENYYIYLKNKKTGKEENVDNSTPKTRIKLYDFVIENGVKYLYINRLPKEFDFKPVSLKQSVKKGLIKDFKMRGKYLYISEVELNNIADTLNNSIAILDIHNKVKELYNVDTYKNINSYKDIVNNEDIFLFDIIGLKHYRIKVKAENKESFIEDMMFKIKENFEYRNTTDPYDRYELLLKELDNELIKKYEYTISTYKEFTFYKLNKTRSFNKLNYVSSKFNSLKRMLSLINTDMNLLNDDLIVELLKDDSLTSEDTLNIQGYLTYLKNKYKNDCVFKNDYNRYIEKKERQVDDVYTIDEWINYSDFLTNIDIHIEKAFNNYRYAKHWLFCLLHFSIDWRANDILTIPPLDMLEIDKYDLDWFKNNEFTISDGQLIVNVIKKHLDNTKSLKREARKHFLIYLNYIIPTAIAFIILERHRRFNDNDTLFALYRIEPKQITNVLGEDMFGFQNRKANRSLLTYCHSIATKTEGYTEIAYSLSSYLRSHKPNLYQVAESTAQYIYATNKDGDVNSISGQLFRRGVFGWLYYALIKIAKTDNLNQIEDTTKMIEILQEELPVKSVEGMSKYLEVESNNRKEIINELLHTPKEELNNIISKLIDNDLSSKEDCIYCLKANKCPYPTQSSCKGCKYSIPTNYSLMSVGNEIISLIDKLEKTDIENYTKRQIYTYQITRLLSVLKEAKQHFDKLDDKYIKTFLDLDTIQNKLNNVKNDKFLLLK